MFLFGEARWVSLAIEVLLLILICHIREEFFDGSRQWSFESWKKITESARKIVFFHPSYLQNLFVLGLRPKSTSSALPHQKYRLMFHFLCLVYTNHYCTHRYASQAKKIMILIEWELIVEISGQKQQSNILKQYNRSFLVMSKYIYIPGLTEKMDWV